MTDRYDASGNSEGQFQAGSNDLVLLNKLGLTDSTEMDEVELDLLEQITESVLNETGEDQVITQVDLCEWHRRWLGNVYKWAGQYRSVNMGKDDFQFAAAHLIPKLMDDLEKKYLSVLMPCRGMGDDKLIQALACVHIEYILIHPFREGNGRLSRLLANVMALQAGHPILDFSYMEINKGDYFTAIRAGLDNEKPMEEIFRRVLLDSQQNAGD